MTPLTPPVEIPKEIPIPQPVQPVQLKIAEASTTLPQPMISSSNDAGNGSGGSGDQTSTSPAGVPGGVPGGVAGGVVGGTVGGEVGGTVGGQLGGVKGGVVGGELGGQLGGAGAGKAGNGAGDQNAPLRVGGDVKAPTVTSKPEPKYTEPARHARVTGVVVVEAVINRQGAVEDVKVLKGLPMGLSEEAVAAVRRWRFKPGTLNGEPVDVIFSLTVNFKMD
jgi:protein TonB